MWAFLHFQREVLKALKRSTYICLCVQCSTVVFHTIKACIAIKRYNSPRNYAILVVDFILFYLLSNFLTLWTRYFIGQLRTSCICNKYIRLDLLLHLLAFLFPILSRVYTFKLYIITWVCALLLYWWLGSFCKLHMYPVNIIYCLDWIRSSELVITGLELPSFFGGISRQHWIASNA